MIKKNKTVSTNSEMPVTKVSDKLVIIRIY